MTVEDDFYDDAVYDMCFQEAVDLLNYDEIDYKQSVSLGDQIYCEYIDDDNLFYCEEMCYNMLYEMEEV